MIKHTHNLISKYSLLFLQKPTFIPILFTRNFHTTRPVLACIVESTEELAHRLAKQNKSVLEINKELEKELCEARSLLLKQSRGINDIKTQ